MSATLPPFTAIGETDTDGAAVHVCCDGERVVALIAGQRVVLAPVDDHSAPLLAE